MECVTSNKLNLNLTNAHYKITIEKYTTKHIFLCFTEYLTQYIKYNFIMFIATCIILKVYVIILWILCKMISKDDKCFIF